MLAKATMAAGTIVPSHHSLRHNVCRDAGSNVMTGFLSALIVAKESSTAPAIAIASAVKYTLLGSRVVAKSAT